MSETNYASALAGDFDLSTNGQASAPPKQLGSSLSLYIYWDQGSLLAHVGLLDPAKLPVTGAEQARKLLNPKLPSNELIHRAERTKT